MSHLSDFFKSKKPDPKDVIYLPERKDHPLYKSRKAQNPPAAAPAQQAAAAYTGKSWGVVMPNEPNQYNYPGTYREYFEEIFRREFSAYRVLRSENRFTKKAVSYWFMDGDRTALAVELVSQNCDVKKLREDCRRSGIPYLRFYYDYEGWWNTRAYVVSRMRRALGR